MTYFLYLFSGTKRTKGSRDCDNWCLFWYCNLARCGFVFFFSCSLAELGEGDLNPVAGLWMCYFVMFQDHITTIGNFKIEAVEMP
uniref:S-adenosylmethionine carrier 1ic/mitochondrial n=1 Tax=Rhizophora mucronata TaxID=61149 RepID=A0A2P2LUA9_RHIMU